MSPGACYSCGNASYPVYALIGHTQWEGSVYLCKNCTMSAMTVFEDLMIPANEQALRREISRLEGKLIDKNKQVTKLEEKNESYRMVLADIGSSDPVSYATVSSASALPPKNDGDIVSETPGFSGSSDNFDEKPSVPDAFDPSELDSIIQRAGAGPVPADFNSDSEPAGNVGKSVARERRIERERTRSTLPRDFADTI